MVIRISSIEAEPPDIATTLTAMLVGRTVRTAKPVSPVTLRANDCTDVQRIL